MEGTPRDNEYYQRQSNLYALLFEAYLDKYFLDSVESFKNKLPEEITPEIRNTIFVVSHICELSKNHLALTLWKIYYDDNGKANTVKKLRRHLHDCHAINYKIIETENIKKIRPQIRSARHGFIAHNFMDDTARTLQIEDLVNALHDIRTIFNELSMDTIDSRVKPLTDTHIFSIVWHEKMGFDPMLINSLIAPINNDTGDQENA